MGKLNPSSLFMMNSNTPHPPEETDPRLLEALAILNQISNAINNINSDEAAQNVLSLQLIVDSAIRVVPGSSAVIYTYNQSTNTFETESRVSSSVKNHLSKEERDADSPRPDGIGMHTIERRKPTFSYEEHDLQVHPYHSARGVKAEACFPLIVAEQVVGILYIYLHEERKFTHLEQLMLDNFVNQAAMAIYHSQRIEGVKKNLMRKDDELNQLRRAGLIISSRLRLEETLDSILQLALEITNAQYGIFRLLDKSGEFLVTSAVSGIDFERPLVEKLPMNGSGIMVHVARTREPLLVPDLREEPWPSIYYPLDSKLEMRAELAVPLIGASGRLEGVLNLESPRPGAFTMDDNHLLQSLATYAITAIQEVRLLDALQEAAQLLVSQPAPKVLEQLCKMANELLNTSSSAIWLTNDSGELILTSFTGDGDELNRVPDDSNSLVISLKAGEDSQALGMFGAFDPATSGERIVHSEWDTKVLTCLANYAMLAIQNESNQKALHASQEHHWTAETFAAVGDISANLLHNMNNKVGTIPVRIQSIQDKYRDVLSADDYLSNNLAEIERSAGEAMQVARDTLANLRPIHMGSVKIIDSVMNALRTVQVPVDVHITLSGLEELPAVIASGQSLTFVFVNLIENAITAMQRQGSILIQGSASNEQIEVHFKDSGPGIPVEIQAQIFELNYSGRSGGNTGKLGFGLWWVKTLMTRLGGSITVESDGGNGTTFRLQLPIAMEKSE